MADMSSSCGGSTMSVDAGWSKTEFKVQKLSHVWIIENFSLCTTEIGEALKSSTFSVDPNDEQQPKWFLKMYPKGGSQYAKDYLGLYLCLDEHNNQTTAPVNAKYKFAILNANGKQTSVKELTEFQRFLQKRVDGWCYFIRLDFLLDEQNGLLPGDRLTIFCEVSIVSGFNMAGRNECPIPRIRLSEDFGALLEKGLLTDCVLCADGEEFQVHKNVLACRSPVFAAMFTNETEEKQTGRVQIEDISAPVLGQLLHFIYTGEAPPLLAEQDMAGDLLAATDKYQLERLKAICEQQLSIGLNKDNVCDVLALADLHNAAHLKKHAIGYIKLHADEVMESGGWRKLVSSLPELHKLVVTFGVKASAKIALRQ